MDAKMDPTNRHIHLHKLVHTATQRSIVPSDREMHSQNEKRNMWYGCECAKTGRTGYNLSKLHIVVEFLKIHFPLPRAYVNNIASNINGSGTHKHHYHRGVAAATTNNNKTIIQHNINDMSHWRTRTDSVRRLTVWFLSCKWKYRASK